MSFLSRLFGFTKSEDKTSLVEKRTMSIDKLAKAFPLAKRENLEKYYDGILETLKKFDISTPQRQAAFLAQCAHESANFSAVVENLNYSKEALVKVWPKHFPSIAFATAYHRNPQKIANRAYRDRMGNGPEESGDGWRYRGRGFIQVTGKNNYTLCGKALGLDLVSTPELLEDPKYIVLSAGWFWNANGLNAFADKEDIVNMTKRINGGTHGLEDRLKKYNEAKKVFLDSGKLE